MIVGARIGSSLLDEERNQTDCENGELGHLFKPTTKQSNEKLINKTIKLF